MDIQIKTQRTVLRRLSLSDSQALFDYRSLPEVYRYQGWFPKTLADAEDFIREHSLETKGEIGQWVQLGIYSRIDDFLMGDCGYQTISKDEAEIGYTLAPPFHGKGIATEIVATLLNYLFEHAYFSKIKASTDPENNPSIRVLEKTGFQKIQLLRKSLEIRGELKDDLIFGRLKG
jgi:RimJ/RimL family protein N-acetyltransferase